MIRYALGIGCDRGTPLQSLQEALTLALKEKSIEVAQILRIATIDKKSDEVGILQLAELLGLKIQFYSAEELALVEVPNPSAVVLKYMGTPAVSEAAALLAAQTQMEDLVIEKYKYKGSDGKNATISVALIKE